MGLFSRKREAPALSEFPPEDYEPVLRCSICTGEQVACMRERSSGRLRDAGNAVEKPKTAESP